MFDTLRTPETASSEEVKPDEQKIPDWVKEGDLVFLEGVYHNPKARQQYHYITHVEILLADGEKTLGSRWWRGKVQVLSTALTLNSCLSILRLLFSSTFVDLFLLLLLFLWIGPTRHSAALNYLKCPVNHKPMRRVLHSVLIPTLWHFRYSTRSASRPPLTGSCASTSCQSSGGCAASAARTARRTSGACRSASSRPPTSAGEPTARSTRDRSSTFRRVCMLPPQICSVYYPSGIFLTYAHSEYNSNLSFISVYGSTVVSKISFILPVLEKEKSSDDTEGNSTAENSNAKDESCVDAETADADVAADEANQCEEIVETDSELSMCSPKNGT